MLELMVSLSVIALIGMSATLVVFQLGRGIEHNRDYATSVRQSENAGYWISRDMRMAQAISGDNVTPLTFLTIGWTEYDTAGDPTYHTVTYRFHDLNNNIGTLMRSHSIYGVNNEETTLIARDIYYNSSNETYTSRASFQNMVLTLKLTSLSDKVLESREYEIVRRINY
jgi:type II secretory pathway pseudopilin PulG